MLESGELQQQQSPSPEPAIAPAGEAQSPSPSDEEPSERGHWWSRLLQTRGHHVDSLSEASPEERNGHTEQPIASGPRSVTLTEEELNERVARQAQSLHDREIARRNREAAQAERTRLRDQDPETYVQLEKQEEQAALVRQQQTGQLMTLLGHVGRQHDAVSIDPIVNALPQTERERILNMPNAGQGLPGRKAIVDEALKTYARLEYERGYREAQAKLRKDSAFRKSVLHELRGSYEEPELYPGNGSPTEGLGDDNVSTILRRQYQGRG